MPSAVTRSISELEGALGKQLFDRHARGMTLTSFGELVLVRARRIEHEFEEARSQLAARGGIGPRVDVHSLFAAMLNGRRLAVVASLAEKRNMSVVAHEFGISQPAISAALKDLEVGLGAPLFERGARGLVPTCAGEIVAFFFKRVLAELRHIGPDLAALGAAPRRRRERPAAAAAVPGSDLGHRARGSPARARQAAWVLSRQGSPSRELLEHFFSDARHAPPVPAVETGDLAVVRGLLLESDMLTALSAHQLRHEIDAGSLVVLDFPLAGSRRQIGLTQRAGALPSPGAKALMAAIEDVVRTSPEFRATTRAQST